MKTIMLLDTETSSLDPETGRLIEVAMSTFSVEHGKHVRSRSWLVRGDSNEAEAVNGIPPGLLAMGDEEEMVNRAVYSIAVKECQAIVAHGAEFDRKWFSPEIQRLTWICSCDDIEWPRNGGSRALAAVALAHGVGVVDAHRAGPDVATLVRLFERVHEMGADVPAMLARASRPKAKFEALVSYDTNQLAKDAGFRWDPKDRMWWRRMAVDDIDRLPFGVREVA